jgi:hypothetical protein
MKGETMTDIPEIAAKLTKAQRSDLSFFEQRFWYGPATRGRVRLCKLGLLEESWQKDALWFRLTPLGVAVRDHIKGETTS